MGFTHRTTRTCRTCRSRRTRALEQPQARGRAQAQERPRALPHASPCTRRTTRTCHSRPLAVGSCLSTVSRELHHGDLTYRKMRTFRTFRSRHTLALALEQPRARGGPRERQLGQQWRRPPGQRARGCTSYLMIKGCFLQECLILTDTLAGASGKRLAFSAEKRLGLSYTDCEVMCPGRHHLSLAYMTSQTARSLSAMLDDHVNIVQD